MMAAILDPMVRFVNAFFPEGTPKRKLLQIVSIILLFEGISVLILFSYDAAWIGVASLLIGLLLVIILNPRLSESDRHEEKDTPGVKLVSFLERIVGGPYAMMLLGAAIIIFVLAYNRFVSSRPQLGDLDTLTILLGGVILAFPLVKGRYRVEASFSLLFILVVFMLLVIPQAVYSLPGSSGPSSIGNWYVHYMLAAPFSAGLNLVGIHSSSSGSYVTLTFQDGTVCSLGISAYCAGLYSFSIFVSAFISFVLVFERLKLKILAPVLGLGLVIAYLGNLFRMFIIGIVGYFYGLKALLWAHENVGWAIFLAWSAVFWYFLLGYVSKVNAEKSSPVEDD